MAAIVKFEGFEDFDGKLQDLLGQKGEQILRKALRAGGEIVQAAVIDAAPVRTDGLGGGKTNEKNPAWDLPPGALKSDIQLRVGRDRNSGGLFATIQPGKYTRFAAEMVEYGHAIYRGRKGKGNKSLGSVPAHPFLRPAWDLSRDEAESVIKQTLQTEVEKLIKQARR
jgi:HK97 gp10 family phage protein